jgi:hypothetical protein
MAEKKPFRKISFEASPTHWTLKWPEMLNTILEEQMKNFKEKLEDKNANKV